ncbi:hypothetical protein SD77_1350 [Bacillus badius]|uniref:Uncharacterized protein n=1 Tax=Bacillus badius TaxID=1455 RepID=A0ABR5ASE1_BACBA|nr:hypothetical protein SD78_3321 [Bacillus badius]KIL77677.1 hypothetical protein SD77_1350 [Bacillus badius]
MDKEVWNVVLIPNLFSFFQMVFQAFEGKANHSGSTIQAIFRRFIAAK